MEVPVSGTGWHGISLPFYTEDSEDPSNSAGFNMYLGDDLVEVNSTTAPNLYMWGHESFDYGWNAKSADEFAYIATHAFAGLKHGAIAYFGGTGGVATGAGPWTLEMRGEYTMGYGNPRYLKLQDVSSSEWFASETAEASSRWVLLGNSELCTIGSTNFFNQATDGGTFGDKLTNVLYVYDSSTQGWSAADFVAPGQAFLVKGLQDAGVSGTQLVLTAYTHGGICVDNAVTFKEEMDILQLEVTGMAVAGDKAQIIADANATLGFDERWDALQMGLANASNLFVMDDGVYLDRNHAALPSGMAVTMDLGFYAPVAGTYSISLNDELMASERRVEIENPETGEILNLSNGSFEFEYASADEVVSWVLHIDRLGHLASADFNSELSGEASVGIEENFQEVQGLQVVCADGTLQLTIQGQERDCRWMGGMFDASGKKVMDLNSQGRAQWQVALSSTMPKGVYHIQLASPRQAPLTAKVILN